VGCTGAAPEVQVVYGRGRCSTSLTNSIRLHVQWHPIFRYLPSIKRPPSEANLRRARERLGSIKQQIQLDTFAFEEEFPDYRFLGCLSGTSSARLCSDIFDAYLTHRQARLHRNDMAAATVRSYRKILDGIWRPHLGDLVFPPVFASPRPSDWSIGAAHRWDPDQLCWRPVTDPWVRLGETPVYVAGDSRAMLGLRRPPCRVGSRRWPSVNALA
jgi:hypothetical protein